MQHSNSRNSLETAKRVTLTFNFHELGVFMI